MRHRLIACSLLSAAALSAHGQTAITKGTTRTEIIDARTSIYQIFGHSGTTTAGEASKVKNAPYLGFAAAGNNVFTFPLVFGVVSSYTFGSPWSADGAPGSPTAITGLNGLSGATGDTSLALLGVFTGETDPSGGVAPAALPWTGASPTSLSPLLHQVFYVGDGHTGFQGTPGSELTFAAPAGATRLYLGFADAVNYTGAPGSYADDSGAVTAYVTLSERVTPAAVPEPGGAALLLAAAALASAALRRRA